MRKNTNEIIVDLVRLNALSDGVFAIALTLLVLDIVIPDNTVAGNLSSVLVGLAPKLVIYLISFIAIGGAWGSHQRMLSQIQRGEDPTATAARSPSAPHPSIQYPFASRLRIL